MEMHAKMEFKQPKLKMQAKILPQPKLILPQLKLTLPHPKFKLLGAGEKAEAEEEVYGIKLQGHHLHNQLVSYYACLDVVFKVCLFSNICCLCF